MMLVKGPGEGDLSRSLLHRQEEGVEIRFMVPWRSGDSHRERLRDFTRQWWSSRCSDISVFEGESPPGRFNRSAAINAAAIGSWDIGVVLDADVIAPEWQVNAAIACASLTGRLSLAYDRYLGLTPHMTELVLDGYQGLWAQKDHGNRGTRFTSDVHESSIVAVPRAVWDTVGGFDERFVGWGQEDVAFVQSVRILVGPVERIQGSVWHLWHANSSDRDRSLSTWRGNQGLGQRYREARTKKAMHALLSERKVTV